MEKNKPKWGKPKLIVLVRGELGEKILYICKSSDSGGVPGSMYGQCQPTVRSQCYVYCSNNAVS